MGKMKGFKDREEPNYEIRNLIDTSIKTLMNGEFVSSKDVNSKVDRTSLLYSLAFITGPLIESAPIMRHLQWRWSFKKPDVNQRNKYTQANIDYYKSFLQFINNVD
ncbi:hypothetical protein ACTFIY_008860 [Dictyostelium cf. discoideum]